MVAPKERFRVEFNVMAFPGSGRKDKKKSKRMRAGPPGPSPETTRTQERMQYSSA
ncbi:MAG TPA: hypothetical protein VF555_24625 [Variovorax sp.]